MAQGCRARRSSATGRLAPRLVAGFDEVLAIATTGKAPCLQRRLQRLDGEFKAPLSNTW